MWWYVMWWYVMWWYVMWWYVVVWCYVMWFDVIQDYFTRSVVWLCLVGQLTPLSDY
jgi:hypothetical protein